MKLHLSSRFVLPMLFTSYLRSSMVLKVGETFLFLPKHTGISVLQVGGVLALMRRGAQGRSGHAAGHLPGSAGFAPPTATDDPAADSSVRWLVSPAAPALGPLSWPGHQPGPGPDLS